MNIQTGKVSSAIMFHHFSSEKHPDGQGAITADQLEQMISFLNQNFNVLSATEYIQKSRDNKLVEGLDICLTFDDALLCQVDVANPVLESLGLDAFYFVYSSVFTGEPDPLEIYRYFRTTQFQNFEDFYYSFEVAAREAYPQLLSKALDGFDPNQYLSAFPFYSVEDRLFRYVRNEIIDSEQYATLMNKLMDELNFDPAAIVAELFMTKQDLIDLSSKGNVVGLHSHTHPTMMHKLEVAQQTSEYKQNYDFLLDLLGFPPISMSHPCGNYNDQTLEILNGFNIEFGFRSNMAELQAKSMLEIPRMDHSNILIEMKK